jgi:hypothetical protein
MPIHHVPITERAPILQSEPQAATGDHAPIARGGQPFRSKAARFLREMAEEHWRLADGSQEMDHHRLHAIKLHTKALKLEHGILDDEL